jgi:hypothetical protein
LLTRKALLCCCFSFYIEISLLILKDRKRAHAHFSNERDARTAATILNGNRYAYMIMNACYIEEVEKSIGQEETVEASSIKSSKRSLSDDNECNLNSKRLKI